MVSYHKTTRRHNLEGSYYLYIRHFLRIFQYFHITDGNDNDIFCSNLFIFSIGFYSPYYEDILPSLMDFSIHIDIW
jgi:hypothetical protein